MRLLAVAVVLCLLGMSVATLDDPSSSPGDPDDMASASAELDAADEAAADAVKKGELLQQKHLARAERTAERTAANLVAARAKAAEEEGMKKVEEEGMKKGLRTKVDSNPKLTIAQVLASKAHSELHGRVEAIHSTIANATARIENDRAQLKGRCAAEAEGIRGELAAARVKIDGRKSQTFSNITKRFEAAVAQHRAVYVKTKENVTRKVDTVVAAYEMAREHFDALYKVGERARYSLKVARRETALHKTGARREMTAAKADEKMFDDAAEAGAANTKGFTMRQAEKSKQAALAMCDKALNGEIRAAEKHAVVLSEVDALVKSLNECNFKSKKKFDAPVDADAVAEGAGAVADAEKAAEKVAEKAADADDASTATSMLLQETGAKGAVRRRLRHAAKCKDIAKKLEVVVAGTGVLKNVVGMRKRMETALAAAKARHGPCRKQAMALYAKMSAAAGKYSDTLQNDMDEINRGKIDRAEGAFQVVFAEAKKYLAHTMNMTAPDLRAELDAKRYLGVQKAALDAVSGGVEVVAGWRA